MNLTLLDLAVRTSVKALEGKYRKHSNVPYIIHPFAVMNCLIGWGVTDDITLAVALHHDTDEDSPATEDWLARFCDLAAQYGTKVEARQVLQIVSNELTFPSSRWTKKDVYLQSFHKASVQALIVKLADRICNTLDFDLAGQSAYAAKYFKHAEQLGKAFFARQSEIQSFYNARVYARAEMAWGALRKRLVVT